MRIPLHFAIPISRTNIGQLANPTSRMTLNYNQMFSFMLHYQAQRGKKLNSK